MNMAKASVKRIEGFLKLKKDYDIAEILADIIHYCEANNLDLNKELDEAKQFVTEDKSYDIANH